MLTRDQLEELALVMCAALVIGLLVVYLLGCSPPGLSDLPDPAPREAQVTGKAPACDDNPGGDFGDSCDPISQDCLDPYVCSPVSGDGTEDYVCRRICWSTRGCQYGPCVMTPYGYGVCLVI